MRPERNAAPVVVAIGNSPAAAVAARDGVRLAQELAAPLVFIYVRRDPSIAWGEPYYQRRLDAEMRAARRALDDALAVAEDAGVPATAEQLAGSPARRVVEFARERGASAIVKGLRAISDFEYEFEMNQLNRKLAPEIESVYIIASPDYSFLSSTGVKEMATFGGDVSDLVPPPVAEALAERLRRTE
jgi:nucleotide-binding universal stress UspA family protein